MGQAEGRGRGQGVPGTGGQEPGAQGALGTPAPRWVPARAHRRRGLPARLGAPGRAPPPRPRSGLIRTTLQGSERFAREGEAPAPAAGRRAAPGTPRAAAGSGPRRPRDARLPSPPPSPFSKSQIRLLERGGGGGGDIRRFPDAGRKGEGGEDPRPVCAEQIQTKTKRLKEQRPGRPRSPGRDPGAGASGNRGGRADRRRCARRGGRGAREPVAAGKGEEAVEGSTRAGGGADPPAPPARAEPRRAERPGQGATPARGGAGSGQRRGPC